MKKRFILPLQPHEASPHHAERKHAIAFCMALVFLMGLAFPLACGNLTEDSTMNESLQIDGATCFTVTAANVALDCAGFSITGNNSTGTYGIYSNQFNTTIRNCNISNFATGIYFSGATNGTISNTNSSSTRTGGSALYITGSSYMTATGSSFIAQYYSAYITGSNGNTIGNSNITASSSDDALYLTGNASGNTIANSTIYATNQRAVYLANGTSNTFINNTIYAAATASAFASAPSGGNTFCLNNFTATAGAYVSDLNGSNYYNCTYEAKNQGNIYANVLNNSVTVWGSIASSIANLYIGSNINYTNTTSLGKFACNFINCADYAPLTLLSTVPYPSNFSFVLPVSWLIAYYAPNNTIPINWTASASPIGNPINYTIYLYLYNGTLNGTLSSTNITNSTFNSTGYNGLRYHFRISACDDSLSLCTYNDSQDFGIYTTSLNATFSIYASNDGAIVPHNYFTEYCSFSCYPDFTCIFAGANLSLVGGQPYRELNTTNYTGSNVGLLFTNLNSSVYKRQCFNNNLYSNSSLSPTREVTIEGEPATEGSILPLIFMFAGIGLIYTATKKGA